MPPGSRIRTDYPLGRKIKDSNLRIVDVVRHTGINHRTMTEYVAGRKVIPWHHLQALAVFLKCRPESLQNPMRVDEEDAVG